MTRASVGDHSLPGAPPNHFRNTWHTTASKRVETNSNQVRSSRMPTYTQPARPSAVSSTLGQAFNGHCHGFQYQAGPTN